MLLVPLWPPKFARGAMSERASKRPVLLLSFTRAIVDSLMGSEIATAMKSF